MRTVAVAGIGKTAFGAFADKDLRTLAVEAAQACLLDAAVDPSVVDAFYLGNFAGPSFVGQNHLAPYIAGELGLANVPATRFEAACASAGAAFAHAWSAVASGMHEAALVVGVEKMTSQSTAKVAEILAAAGDVQREGKAGATFPALFAMIARRHMFQYGTTREHLAAVAVKNHSNGAKNPQAHMRKVVSMEQVLAGKPVSDPLTVYDCSLVSDGAAAILIMSADRVRAQNRIHVLACAQTSDHLALEDKADITSLPAVRLSAQRAYKMAGLSPAEIDLAEVHDCFTIAEILAMEELGFCKKGEGGPYISSGATTLSGAKPVNTSGGLKSKGHPVGATGVAQLCDLVIQMRCQAGERQVPRHRIGLAQNLGGSGATSVVTILGAA